MQDERKGVLDKVTVQRHKGSDGAILRLCERQSSSTCKGPEAGVNLACLRNCERPQWLEQSLFCQFWKYEEIES